MRTLGGARERDRGRYVLTGLQRCAVVAAGLVAPLMPPLIPDWRYLTEKNQIALAWFAEKSGGRASGSNDVICGGVGPCPVEARFHDHVILRWDPCHGNSSTTFV